MKYSTLFLAMIFISIPTTAAVLPQQHEQDAREQARAAAIAASKAFGTQEQVTLEEPSRSYFDWGAILQPNGEVVSVRNDSVAAEMGIQTGDQLTHVDGTAIDTNNLGNTLALFEPIAHGQHFTVRVDRSGQVLELTGTAQATVIPGWKLEVTTDVTESPLTSADTNSCGRISVFQTPPFTRDLHPAFINTVDGENIRLRNPSFKVAAQQHRIGVHELISDRSLRRSNTMEKEKYLTIEVEPNKTYHIAAHFIRQNRYDRFDGGYWEPVIWKVTEQSCKLD